MLNLDLWQQQEYTGMKPGLGRINRFLKRAGNPQRAFPVIHVAGTNGKGSTVRMISQILEVAGYRTGLYTSPHLISINERIQIDSSPIPAKALCSLAKEYDAEARQCSLTFFELMTGIAFIYFAEEKVDIAVLETGLGGRYDATNVVQRPLLSVITDVDYDHQSFLGAKLSEISYEKAGIIKSGCPVVTGAEKKVAVEVIRNESRSMRAPLFELTKDFGYTIRSVNWTRKYQTIRYRGLKNDMGVKLPLLGEHQARNCSLALSAIELLRERGYAIRPGSVEKALGEVKWPGRFEIYDVSGRHARKMIIDGAHNRGGMRSFVRTWEQAPWSRQKRAFVFGVLKDKDYEDIIRLLAPLVRKVILVPLRSTPRGLEIPALVRCWQRYLGKKAIEISDSVRDALRRTRSEKIVGVTGSLYLVGEVINELRVARNYHKRS